MHSQAYMQPQANILQQTQQQKRSNFGSRTNSGGNKLPAQLLMRPLKHYVEPGAHHLQRDLKELVNVSLGQPTNTVLNPNLTVKGGGAGLISTLTQKRAKTLKPKGAWISPFAHRSNCRDNKKRNLALNQCTNMERSVYVNHCLSLNSHLKPDRLYSQLKTQYQNLNNDGNGGQTQNGGPNNYSGANIVSGDDE